MMIMNPIFLKESQMVRLGGLEYVARGTYLRNYVR